MMMLRSALTHCLRLLALLCVCGTLNANAQTPPQAAFPTGTLIERVVCRADATQSYALYLPKNYAPDRAWPILYGFDPGGRGAAPVKLYQAAAEKYGYVVVGSHNSRNGPGVKLSEIVQALWDDTHERLALAERRAYTTGLSGGARVASAVANALRGQVTGAILHGAAFMQGVNVTKDLPFGVYGLAGVEDFNYFELKQLDRALAEAGVPHRLTIWDGGHAWAPEAACVAAVGWLEVQAMQRGLRNKDEALLNDLFDAALAQARAAETARQMGAAWTLYESLVNDFRGLRDVSEYERQAAALKATPACKEDLKREKNDEQAYNLRTREFFELRERMRRPDEHDGALGEAKRAIAALHKRSAEPNASSERLLARRLLSLYNITLREEGNALRAQKKYRELLDNLLLANELRPGQPQTLYQLAVGYALNGDKKQTLETLQRAVAQGWRDAAELARQPAFEFVRREPAYQKLLETLTAK